MHLEMMPSIQLCSTDVFLSLLFFCPPMHLRTDLFFFSGENKWLIKQISCN